ncbi:MAG: efflux RND transporter periplasmic adaptor subunit [Gemmatimonadota bacterium]
MNGSRPSRPAPRAVLLTVAAFALAACDRGEPGQIEPPARSPELTVSLPAPGVGAVDVPARVLAEQTADIATRVSAAVERVTVDEGSEVAGGDVLVVLDASSIEAEIARTAASARAARAYFERIESLARDGAATAQELDDARAGLEGAEAAVRAARGQRSYARLRAPFAGVIVRRDVDPGDLAVPGRPVLVLSGRAGAKVVADVPAAAAGLAAPGRRVTVRDPVGGLRRTATITRRVPVVEPSTQRVRVEARFDPRGEMPGGGAPDGGAVFVPGSYVRLELARESDGSSWIPADALWRMGQLAGVYVLEGDTLRLRWVRTGRVRDDGIEVLSGITLERPVVRRPPASLRDGMPAGPVTREAWTPAAVEESR